MNAIVIIYILVFLCLCFSIYVLRLNFKSRLYRLFFILCIFISLSALTAAKLYTSENKQELFFWIWIELLMVVMCWATNFHFFVKLTNQNVKAFQRILIYLPALINVILDLTVAPMVLDFIKVNNHWEYIPGKNITYYFYIVYSSSYAVISMILVYRWGRSSILIKERIQAKTILLITIPLWLIFGSLDYILTLLNSRGFLPLGPVGRLIYVFGIWFALVRYRFLVPRTSFVAEEIINNIQEIVIILNPSLKIITANTTFTELYSIVEVGQCRLSLSDIIQLNSDISNILSKIIKRELGHSYCRITYKKGNEKIFSDSYFSPILDEFGDVSGILIISRENKDVSRFKDKYHLTDRQMDIINLIVAGLTNLEISKKLRIAKKTTEAHIFNIYNRLGINNKIELYNLAKEYNLLVEPDFFCTNNLMYNNLLKKIK